MPAPGGSSPDNQDLLRSLAWPLGMVGLGLLVLMGHGAPRPEADEDAGRAAGLDTSPCSR
jgi:hypothetical protein